jgi:thiol-disulfide isomerase/thioredoxin
VGLPALAAALILGAVTANPAVGQPAPGSLTGFEQVGFVLELDEQRVADAEIYQSRSAGAYLILSSVLQTPVLLRAREARVESVHVLKINKKTDGSIDLLPGASLEVLGGFRVTADRTGVAFDVGGRQAVMKEKPPLLGAQDLEGMRSYSPVYLRTAEAYVPSGPILEKLRNEQRDVRISVFFGTWCPFCQQMVPRMMRVAGELGDSKIRVDFYGLPRGISSDQEARRLEIHGVPTGIVFVDGKEVGRISGNSWKVPELALNSILVNHC